MPLYERARIEVYLPDVSRSEYQDLLVELEQEFTYTFGGCSTLRGLEGNYLSRGGLVIRDRVNLVYTDTPFSVDESLNLVARYADELRQASFEALDEEAILVVVYPVYHAADSS